MKIPYRKFMAEGGMIGPEMEYRTEFPEEADSISSPSWHKNVLQEREEQIKTGVDEFMDWDKAKKQIKET